MSTGDLTVLGVILLLVIVAIVSLIRSYLFGKCSCGCENCGCGCSKVLKIEDKRN